MQFYPLQRTLQRLRNEILPKNVSTVAGIVSAYDLPDVMLHYGTTKGQRPFFKTAYECSLFSYCIFASDEIIEMYEDKIPLERRDFLMDATFKVCPFGPFNQLLIVYISYLEKVFFVEVFFAFAFLCVLILFFFISMPFRSFLY